MTDFLAAVKTVRNNAEDTLPVLREVRQSRHTANAAQAVPEVKRNTSENKTEYAQTPEEALNILRNRPNVVSLRFTLQRIRNGFQNDDFDIQMPGPRQAQIINAIVNVTWHDFGSILDANERSIVLDCLTNVAGLNAVVARLRFLSGASKDSAQGLAELFTLAKTLFSGDNLCYRIWAGTAVAPPKPATTRTKIEMTWKEFVGLIASGKVISTLAHAEDRLKEHDIAFKPCSLSSGAAYVAWLGRNFAHFLTASDEEKDVDFGSKAAITQLMSRSFAIGYPVALVRSFFASFLSQAIRTPYRVEICQSLLKMLPVHTKRQLLESTLRWLGTTVDEPVSLNSIGSASLASTKALTGFIAVLCDSKASMSEFLVACMKDPVILSSIPFQVRRASIACLSHCESDELVELLETLITTFGNRLFIDHAPTLQQEGVAQVLLLSAGYVSRKTPMALLVSARSSDHMQGVSNRLDSNNQRARWLGMVVGTALSKLVDKEGSRMSFGTDEMATAEAQSFQDLVTIDDRIGDVSDTNVLLAVSEDQPKRGAKKTTTLQRNQELPILGGKQTFGPPRPLQPIQTEVIGNKVTEIQDDESEEDDDLKPYAKPDSDPEDSDEDATLVDRNKPKSPVYVRDLMRMLKDDKDHGRFRMAIEHAPALIRRKSNYGREVKDHAEELALMLCDLQDPFNTDNFDELKLQALIAVLLSDVKTIAPWLSKQCFAGDYGLGQRCIMMSALGLGGRELAGFRDQDDLNPAPPQSKLAFPSKQLSGRLHNLYDPTSSSVKRLHAASEDMHHQLINPLALSAADQSTSHLNAVKIRTFSSRMNVERTKRKPAANELAKVFGHHFFFPLATRYQQEVAAYGSGSVFTSAPFVLVTFLKTLALLLHASGPATVDLPDITTSFWELVLSLRAQAAANKSVVEAVLFALLTILEVNGNTMERLSNDNTDQIMQTQQWVEVVFERIGGGNTNAEGSAEETRVRTLAAGVLMKINEVVQTKQFALMGELRRN